MKKLYFKILLLAFLVGCCRKPEELKPYACFNYFPMDNLTISDTIYFTNCSENFTSILWDFGDGNVSTEIHPKHVYKNFGTYSVKQTIKNADLFDTLLISITINPNCLFFGQDSNRFTIIKNDTLIDEWKGIAIYDLDLNSDLIPELKFSVENVRLFAGSLLVRSEIRVDLYNENINFISDSIYIKAANYGDTLEVNSNWHLDSYLLLKLTQDCYDCVIIFEGYWKDADKKFIGFRLNDKRGWIKAGLKNNCALYIYEYALEK